MTGLLRLMDEDDRPLYLFVLAGSFSHCEEYIALRVAHLKLSPALF